MALWGGTLSSTRETLLLPYQSAETFYDMGTSMLSPSQWRSTWCVCYEMFSANELRMGMGAVALRNAVFSSLAVLGDCGI